MKEKRLREEAVREKEELERRLMQLQEEVRIAQEALVRQVQKTLSFTS